MKTKNAGKFYFHSILSLIPPQSIVTRAEREGGGNKEKGQNKTRKTSKMTPAIHQNGTIQEAADI